MIDKYMTKFQCNIIKSASTFVHRESSRYVGTSGPMSLGRFNNRIVMFSAVGATCLMDHIKLPLSAIEELALGILLIPAIPFIGIDSCLSRFVNFASYTITSVKNMTLGLKSDFIAMKIAFLSPHEIPFFSPSSFLGSRIMYIDPAFLTDMQKSNPSLAHY